MPAAASAAERAAEKWGTTTSAAARSSEEFSKRVQGAIRSLEFERQQLTRNSAEQARFQALRRAGVSATSAEGAAITASVRALQAQQAATAAAVPQVSALTAAYSGLLRTLGPLASALSVAAVAYSVWSAGMKAGNLGEQAEQVGLTTEQLQAYRLAAAQAGIETEQLDAAMMRLTRAMGSANEGNDEMIARFTKLGVKLLDVNGELRKPADILPELARGLLNVSSETQRNSMMMELMGKSGSRLVTMLGTWAQGNDAIVASAKNMNAITNAEVIAAWDKFDDQIKVTRAQWGTFAATVAVPLATGGLWLLEKGMASVGRGIDILARNMGNIAEGAAVAGVALALAFGPAVLGAMATSFGTLASAGVAAMTAITAAAMANPFVALAVGITAALAAVYYFRDEIQKAIGVDVVGIAKTAANFVIGSFVAAYEDIKAVWNSFPDIIGGAVNGAINMMVRGLNKMIDLSIDKLNELVAMVNRVNPFDPISKFGKPEPIKEIANQQAASLAAAVAARNAAVNAAMSKDYIGDIVAAFTPSTPGTPPSPQGNAGSAGVSNPVGDAAKKAGAAASAKAGDAYDKMIASAQSYIEKKNAETSAVGMNAEAAARMVHQQELINKATEAGIKLGPAQRAELDALAAGMATADAAFKAATFMGDAEKDAASFIAAQQLEAQALGMTAEAAARLRFEQEMLNKATADGTILTTAQKDRIRELAGSMAAAGAATAATAAAAMAAEEEMRFAKDTFRSFFTDFRSDIAAGKSFWESFGNAAMNALDKIASKLMEMAANKLFEAAFSGGGSSGGGGFLGSILGAIGGIFGGGIGGGGFGSIGGGTGTGIIGNIFSAKGNVFSGGNVIPFARGGIVGGPTLFPMANGMGLMGEAGPEAVVPLHRARDGGLGIRASGMGAGPETIMPLHRGSDGGLGVSAAFAKGAAFAGGNVIPFEQGGLINSPTPFSARGMMDEAVMPLRRGPDGRRGVSAGDGGQSGRVDLYVHLNNDLLEVQIDNRSNVNISRAAPAITDRATSQSRKEVVPVMNAHHAEREGDWRTG